MPRRRYNIGNGHSPGALRADHTSLSVNIVIQTNINSVSPAPGGKEATKEGAQQRVKKADSADQRAIGGPQINGHAIR